MMMKYSSGEEPMVGDKVECEMGDRVQELCTGRLYTVESVLQNSRCIEVNNVSIKPFAARFKLIHRKDEEMKTKEEEFKVDKVGFYETRDGKSVTVTSLESDFANSGDINETYPILGVLSNSTHNSDEIWTMAGVFDVNSLNDDRDIVKYIGETLPSPLKESAKEFDKAIDEVINRTKMRIGWWRQRDGGIALVYSITQHEDYPVLGIADYTTNSCTQSWCLNGIFARYSSIENNQTDIIEFLAPLVIPEFPEPDVITGPGTYRADNGFDWIVFFGSRNNEYRAVRHENVYVVNTDGEMVGAGITLVEKISDEIEKL